MMRILSHLSSIFSNPKPLTKPLSNGRVEMRVEPLKRDFKTTKDLFEYGRNRCTEALKGNTPYEHTVIANIKTNKVISEFKGDKSGCHIDLSDILDSDKKNIVLMHGHPNGTPISPVDIEIMLDNNIEQVIAFDEKGLFSLVAKKKELVPNQEKYFKKFKQENLEETYDIVTDNNHEMYNLMADHVLKKHAPLMGLRYLSNYSYLK